MNGGRSSVGRAEEFCETCFAFEASDKIREILAGFFCEAGKRAQLLTASGISKKFLPKVFTLFGSQMSFQGGTGIGLAFCKLIMRSYGGNITCSSIEGEYTGFILKFPKL